MRSLKILTAAAAVGLPWTAAHGATVLLTTGHNGSWLNASWGTPAAAPTTGNDYVMVNYNSPTETIIRTSPAGGTGDGNTTFPGLSLSTSPNTRLLIKQLVNQGASIDGDPGTPGAQGTLIFNGGRSSFAPNSSTGAGRAGFNATTIQVNAPTIIDATDLGLDFIYNGALAGSGALTIQKELPSMTNRSRTTFFSAGTYTGAITVNDLSTLDFDSPTPQFGGLVNLVGTGQLNVDNDITFIFGTLTAGGTPVPEGSYTTAPSGFENALTFCAGATLTIAPIPEPTALASLGALGLLMLRRRTV
ncbi:MAG TPA: hypothetical protein PKB10_14005 [Tepidisphaeraceae bacterium]|nr:hypothetical protein [Tepidisphaeraceae bacterium]